MPIKPRYAGVYIEEIATGVRTIEGVATSIAAFVDFFKRGPKNKAVRVSSMAEFKRRFGGLDKNSEASYAIQQFFLNGGKEAWVVRVDLRRRGRGTTKSVDMIGDPVSKKGIHALEDVDLFNILCIPRTANVGRGTNDLNPTEAHAVIAAAEAYCEKRRALFLMDTPRGVKEPKKIKSWLTVNDTLRHRNAALYYPRVRIPDPLNKSRLRSIGASGTIAGLYARMDSTRGVWRAPAGPEAVLRNVTELERVVTDQENRTLDQLAINCLRNFQAYGNVSWGARTLAARDQQTSEWKYVPVRRLALFIEESLLRGTKWAVLELNDEPLWAQIRLNIGAFLQRLFQQGAFQGRTPREAYFVKCDSETTTQNDIDSGRVNIVVGFAPLKPAEFVVIKIQQNAGRVPP
jgi:phage tail sheath protein FI